jgi:hypothetical protein
MNDTTNTGYLDADDRIDALAREAGTALRREPSPRQLARVHRAKRNRQIGQAVLGCFAVLAIGGGAFVLLDRDDGAELVPAEPPTTPVVTAPPETVPQTTASTPTVPPTTAGSVPASTAPAVAGPPEVVYLGNEDRAGEQVQRVVDLATGAVLRTEPLDDARYIAAWPHTFPRDTSALQGIRYGLAGAVDACGQSTVTVDGGPDASLLPPVASIVTVSSDGTKVVTVSAASCPVDGEIGVTDPVTSEPFDQLVQVFDADDPTTAGRLVMTLPSPERHIEVVHFSPDGRWAAVGNRFRAVDAFGNETDEPSLLVVDLDTGQVIQHGEDLCTLIAAGQQGNVFVGNVGVAFTKRCDDGVYVELWSLTDPQATPQAWLLPGVPTDAYVTVEVWEPSVFDSNALVTFVAAAYSPDGSNVVLIGTGDSVEEFPVADARASFFPLAEIDGD